MIRKEYNGWTNYETWCVNLWLTNDQSTDTHWHIAAQEAFEDMECNTSGILTQSEHARYYLCEQLKEELDANIPETLNGTVYADLIGAALSEVNWAEIANAFLEEKESDGMKYKPMERVKD